MMVKSSDNGATWSEPINITRQLKKYDWRMTFQGPGRGITMKDGTLVIPMQHQEKINGSYTLNSGIAYSTDHGLTWHTHNLACTVTSECTVAEIEPGVLLLSMRDETGSHTRRNFITTDLGRSWTAHSSDKQWLEPTCEACLLHVDAGDNASGKELLLFSNPNSGGRNHVSIRVSTDDGLSWNNTVLLDEGGNLGTYSCITMIDPDTVGIVYESSRGNILFQSVPIADLVR